MATLVHMHRKFGEVWPCSFYLHDAMLAWVYAMAFPSVGVSHTCFLSKWLNVLSKFFHHLIAPSF